MTKAGGPERVPSGPGRIGEGDPVDEAPANIKEAIEHYLDQDNGMEVEGSM